MANIPLIDLSGDSDDVAQALDRACRDDGFFCLSGHGVSDQLTTSLHDSARAFFDLPIEAKQRVAMAVGGRAWRGWFPLGGEVTNGVPDRKEGFYFGTELAPNDPRVIAELPLHGPNLFPAEVPQLRIDVLAWIDQLTQVGHQVMELIAIGLGLDKEWFRHNLTAEPTVLFRIFQYPMDGPGQWGVAEHTDYGLLTLLAQDDCGGLQVKSRSGWVDVDPIPNTLVCNIGDMLERMSGGRYRSTAHRVRNLSGRDRLSFPLFFDPSWDALVPMLPLAADSVDNGPDHDESSTRWDGRSVFDFEGTYGEYLIAKVSKVFPALVSEISSRVI
jgi:isopenicillin N synthase-like dioxygenase